MANTRGLIIFGVRDQTCELVGIDPGEVKAEQYAQPPAPDRGLLTGRGAPQRRAAGMPAGPCTRRGCAPRSTPIGSSCRSRSATDLAASGGRRTRRAGRHATAMVTTARAVRRAGPGPTSTPVARSGK
jgi:hypothetical protein